MTEAGYTGVLGTDIEQEFTRYLKPGDVVTDKTVIADISEEKATGAGVGYFITTRTDWYDQDDELVGWLTFRVLKFIPKDAPAPAAEDGGGAAPAAPTRVKPPMGHDNAWWWNAVANEGILPIQRCTSCGKLRHPPGPMCDACGATGFDHVAASGQGTLHSFTIIRYPQFPGYDFPIIAALVDLEEGVRVVSNVFECEPEAVEIGMKLELFITRSEKGRSTSSSSMTPRRSKLTETRMSMALTSTPLPWAMRWVMTLVQPMSEAMSVSVGVSP